MGFFFSLNNNGIHHTTTYAIPLKINGRFSAIFIYSNIKSFKGQDGKYHILYRVTNKLNYMEYVGIHSTINIKKSRYIGSGKLLKEDIKKYGRTNFVFQIIEFFDSREKAKLKEKKIVNEQFVERKDTYNIALGGGGGGSYGKPHSEETKRKMRNSLKGRHISKETRKRMSEGKLGKRFTERHKQNISNSLKGKNNPMFGKKFSEEYRNKLKEAGKKKVIIDGVLFNSIKEASEKYNVHITTITRWIKKGKAIKIQ